MAIRPTVKGGSLSFSSLNFAYVSGLVYVALTLLWFSSAWVSPTTRWVGVGGDGPDFIWYLAWMPWAIAHLQNPLYTTLINFPHGANLAWDTSAPLLTLLALPLTLAFGPVLAYNVVVTFGVAASAWSVALVTRRWVTRAVPAFLAGLMFLMAPDVAGQALEHPFMVFVPFIPLTMLWVDWAVVKGQGSWRRAGLLLAALVIAEFYCSEELAVDLVMFLCLGLACLWTFQRWRLPQGWQRLLKAAGLAVGATLAATGPFLGWQLFGPGAIRGAIIPPLNFSARLLAFVVPGPLQLLSFAGGYRLVEGPWYNLFEFGTYIGVPALGLIAMLAWRERHQVLVRTLVGLLLLVIILSLGAVAHVTGRSTGVPLPGGLLLRLPVVSTLLPVRFAVFADVLVAVLVGISVDHGLRSRWRRLVPWIAILTAVSWLPYILYPASSISTPPYFREAGNVLGQHLLVVPFAQNWETSEAMQWQAVADMRFSMVDGYYTRVSGVWPSGATRFFYHGPPLNYFTWDLWTLEQGNKPPAGLTQSELGFTPIARWHGPLEHPRGKAVVLVNEALKHFVSRYLDGHDVDAVVLGPTSEWYALRRFLTEVLAEQPRLEAGVAVWKRPVGGSWQR